MVVCVVIIVVAATAAVVLRGCLFVLFLVVFVLFTAVNREENLLWELFITRTSSKSS